MTSLYVIQLPRWVAVVLLVVVAGLTAAPSARDGQAQAAKQGAKEPVPPGPDEQALAEYKERLDAYVALHKKHETELGPLPDKADPKRIHAHQQNLLKRLQTARAAAKQGDVLSPAMQTYVRRVIAQLFKGPAGGQLRASIMDENPVSIKLRVNMEYPTEVPLSTMPPAILKAFPEPPEEIEYRFIGDDLILLDPHAHMIVDFVDRALPK